MAGEQATAQAQPETTAQATGQAPAQTPPAEAKQAKADLSALPKDVQDYIGELREEAARHRKAKADAEKAARDAIDAEARQKGDFKTLYEKALADKDAADKLAASLAPFKGAVEQRVESLRKSLGDRAAFVPASLSPADALVVLEGIAAQAPGKPAAPPTAAGSPPAQAGTVLDPMQIPDPVERRRYIASLTPEQRKQLVRQKDTPPPWIRR